MIAAKKDAVIKAFRLGANDPGVRKDFSLIKFEDTILSGSYVKAIGLKKSGKKQGMDIDILVVLGGEPFTTVSEVVMLKKWLTRVAESFVSTVTAQDRSIGFVYNDIEFDMVPTWKKAQLLVEVLSSDPPISMAAYVVTSFETPEFHYTSPPWHKARLTSANKKSKELLKPCIKLMKYWNRQKNSFIAKDGKKKTRLRSFHLEVLACEFVLSSALVWENRYELLCQLFLCFTGLHLSEPKLDPFILALKARYPLDVEVQAIESGQYDIRRKLPPSETIALTLALASALISLKSGKINEAFGITDK